MKLLFVLGGGIGNIIQATPAIQLAIEKKHTVDLKLTCNSTNDLEIFKLPGLRNLFTSKHPTETYTAQLNGPFTPGKRYKTNHVFRPRISYARHVPEAEIYLDLIKQLDIKGDLPEINIKLGGEKEHVEKNTVAIYPGSKPNWAMKRWDKYDELAQKFENVIIVGKKEDVHSHGNPTWITRPWNWPNHVKIVTGNLQYIANTLSQCQMFIGNDGGLAHIAAATKIPTYIIFGPSSYIKNKPYAKNAHVLGLDLPCRPCQFKKGPDGKQIFDGNRYTCQFDMKCMRELTVESVLNQIKKAAQ